MKKIIILLVVSFLFTNLTLSAEESSKKIIATSDYEVPVSLIENVKKLPAVGDMSVSVVTVYEGGAFGTYALFVVIENKSALYSGDDNMPRKVFMLRNFTSSEARIFAEKLSDKEYSISIISSKLYGSNDYGEPLISKVKMTVMVELTKDGVNEEASVAEAIFLE
jgi:hypothetical protein